MGRCQPVFLLGTIHGEVETRREDPGGTRLFGSTPRRIPKRDGRWIGSDRDENKTGAGQQHQIQQTGKEESRPAWQGSHHYGRRPTLVERRCHGRAVDRGEEAGRLARRFGARVRSAASRCGWEQLPGGTTFTLANQSIQGDSAMKHSQHGEDGYSKLQSLFEDADALRDTISELIGESRGGNQAAIDTLERKLFCGAVGTSLVGSQWFTVSTGQSSSVDCAHAEQSPRGMHSFGVYAQIIQSHRILQTTQADQMPDCRLRWHTTTVNPPQAKA